MGLYGAQDVTSASNDVEHSCSTAREHRSRFRNALSLSEGEEWLLSPSHYSRKSITLSRSYLSSSRNSALENRQVKTRYRIKVWIDFFFFEKLISIFLYQIREKWFLNLLFFSSSKSSVIRSTICEISFWEGWDTWLKVLKIFWFNTNLIIRKNSSIFEIRGELWNNRRTILLLDRRRACSWMGRVLRVFHTFSLVRWAGRIGN